RRHAPPSGRTFRCRSRAEPGATDPRPRQLQRARLFPPARAYVVGASRSTRSCDRASSTASTASGSSGSTTTTAVFVQWERFAGVLAGLVKGTLAKTEAGFEQINAALKARVEPTSAES